MNIQNNMYLYLQKYNFKLQDILINFTICVEFKS